MQIILFTPGSQQNLTHLVHRLSVWIVPKDKFRQQKWSMQNVALDASSGTALSGLESQG